MPVPTIPLIADLNFIVGRRSSFNVPIGNTPTYGYGVIEWDTFLINYIGFNTINISGTPTRAGRYTGTLYAGNADGEANRTFNVIVTAPTPPPPTAAAPVISQLSSISIVGGTNYTNSPIQIPISNSPTRISIEGLALGLNYRSYSGGVEIIGQSSVILNLRPSYPIRDAIVVRAENSGGSDTKTIPIIYSI